MEEDDDAGPSSSNADVELVSFASRHERHPDALRHLPPESAADKVARSLNARDDAPPAEFIIGIVGTGAMASAHAYRWTQLGYRVVVASREVSRAESLARVVDDSCVGACVGSCIGADHVTMLRLSDLILLCIPPGPPSTAFVDANRAELAGKMLVDMTAPFSRQPHPRAGPLVQPPPPYLDHVNFLRDRLGDPTASWVKAFANLAASSIASNDMQPVEVAGDPRAKAAVSRLLTQAGWEPLDCGSRADVPKIEPGFHLRRRRHPAHVAFHGLDHQ